MLNQLEQLAQRLETALQFTTQLVQEKKGLEATVARLEQEAEGLRAQQLDAQIERARLTHKIEDAQARIQSILDKLPPDDSKRQLDLLGNVPNTAPDTHAEEQKTNSYSANTSYGLNVKPGAPT